MLPSLLIAGELNHNYTVALTSKQGSAFGPVISTRPTDLNVQSWKTGCPECKGIAAGLSAIVYSSCARQRCQICCVLFLSPDVQGVYRGLVDFIANRLVFTDLLGTTCPVQMLLAHSTAFTKICKPSPLFRRVSLPHLGCCVQRIKRSGCGISAKIRPEASHMPAMLPSEPFGL